MLKLIKTDHIKPLVLIGLLIGSILFLEMVPVEITSGDAIKDLFYFGKL